MKNLSKHANPYIWSYIFLVGFCHINLIASQLVVDQHGAGDFTTIQEAIYASLYNQDVNSIVVCEGIYDEEILFCGASVTLQSTDPLNENTVSNTIITGGENFAVHFDCMEDPNSVLSGFTIMNKAVRVSASSPTITNNIFINCQTNAVRGEYGARPVIEHNTISGCKSDALLDCDGIIRANTITDNDANGIAMCEGLIEDNEISFNDTGINQSHADIRLNEIFSNRIGISLSHGVILENYIGKNTEGAILGCDGVVMNNEICGNTAINGAGLRNCDAWILNNTIVGNKASGTGGAVYLCGSIIKNNIIAYNSAAFIGGIFGPCQNSYNCIYQCTGGMFGGSATLDPNDIIADPLFAANGAWQDGQWTDGDYHLQSSVGRYDPLTENWTQDSSHSPCIDRGDPASETVEEPYPNGNKINLGRWGATDQASKSDSGQSWQCTGYIIGDMNEDCRINFSDAALLRTAWSDSEPLTPGQFANHWSAIIQMSADVSVTDTVIDSNDNIYIAVSVKAENAKDDYGLIKIDPQGNELWKVTYDGYDSDQDTPAAMCLDPDENICLTGKTKTAAGHFDFCTVKFSPVNGDWLWIQTYDNTPVSMWDQANDITTDNAGNIIITGESFADNDYDCLTIKYDNAGNHLWTLRYDSANGNDSGKTLCTDQAGNVYIAGYCQNPAPNSDILVIKYDPNGVQHWTKQYSPPAAAGNDTAVSIIHSKNQELYIAGEIIGIDGTSDYCLIKMDPHDGEIIWQRTFASEGAKYDHPKKMAIENQSIYITGYTSDGVIDSFLTLKYNCDGDLLWQRKYDGNFNVDKAQDIALDSKGYVYAAGITERSAGTYDFATVKYDPQGTFMGIVRYDGSQGAGDWANHIVIDSTDSAITTGTSQGSEYKNPAAVKSVQQFTCDYQIIGDIDHNCSVDIYDLQILIENWLNCNRIPAQACLD